MSNYQLEANIRCIARSKTLNKAWWQVNVIKLALIALQTQTLKSVKQKKLSFSVSVVDEEFIKQLNNAYRKINKVTDVLSFPTDEADYEEDDELDLGDIVICLQKLKLQANEFGHSLEREAAFLFTHGFLHLLGYDHIDLKSEQEMFTLQDKILSQSGFLRL